MTTERDLKIAEAAQKAGFGYYHSSGTYHISTRLVSMLSDFLAAIQPEPVSVPEEMVPVAYGGMAGYHDYKIGNVTIVSSAEYAKGWNQCRRAMLAAAPSVQQSDESEPQPGLMRESGTQAEPQLFGKAEQVPDSFKQGVEASALLIDRKAELYAERFGHDDMGALSFGSGAHAEIKRDTHSGLIELAEEIRATFLVQQPEVQQPAQALTDEDIARMWFDCNQDLYAFARAIKARVKGGV